MPDTVILPPEAPGGIDYSAPRSPFGMNKGDYIPPSGAPSQPFSTDPRTNAPLAPAVQPSPAPNLAPLAYVDKNARTASGGPAGEMAAYVQRAIGRGDITAAEGAAILKAETGVDFVPSTASPEQAAWDAAHGISEYAPSPESYAPHLNLADIGDLDPAVALAAQGEFGQILGAARIDPSVANGFVRQLYEAQRELDEAPDDAARQQVIARWENDRRSIWGDKTDSEELLAPVVSMLSAIGDRNGVLNRLKASGTLGHPAIMRLLVEKAARLAAWKSGRPAK